MRCETKMKRLDPMQRAPSGMRGIRALNEGDNYLLPFKRKYDRLRPTHIAPSVLCLFPHLTHRERGPIKLRDTFSPQFSYFIFLAAWHVKPGRLEWSGFYLRTTCAFFFSLSLFSPEQSGIIHKCDAFCPNNIAGSTFDTRTSLIWKIHNSVLSRC